MVASASTLPPAFRSARTTDPIPVHGARPRVEHFHTCCGADWLICGRLAIGLVDSAPQAKRIANPQQDTILPHNICENAPACEFSAMWGQDNRGRDSQYR